MTHQCQYCESTENLRVTCDGREYGLGLECTCGDCFTGSDEGPSFDDLPLLRDVLVEARALELHQARNVNAKRHGNSPRLYEAAERDFCIREAKAALDEEEYQASLEAERIARMSVLSDLQISKIIADIDAEYDELFYRNGFHDAYRASLRSERHVYVMEQMRRSLSRPLSVRMGGDEGHREAAE